MKGKIVRVLAAGLLMVPLACLSQRLDDSASPRSYVHARTTDSPLEQRGRDWVVKFGRIDYRLALAPYVGRRARIYYVMPSLIRGLRSSAGVRLKWQGGQLFASGAATPGERRQVWAGLVQEAWMNEALDVALDIDSAQLRSLPGSDMAFEAYFEIEVLP